MLTRFCIIAALLSLLLLVSINAVPADNELFQDTVEIQEGVEINSVTPFKAIFFPKVDTSACRFCRPPVSFHIMLFVNKSNNTYKILEQLIGNHIGCNSVVDSSVALGNGHGAALTMAVAVAVVDVHIKLKFNIDMTYDWSTSGSPLYARTLTEKEGM
ncbi:hypothetical protein Ocin01_15893 [Orchesella cincta]|uniref:Uncharacterized protein n=1 Tax=Orchesella cincta TaxID=48709 RepID=A0A1D2MCT7_ORCCI|nr:hypothetical protein Ocin01_15893 [Orchesella cincta]